MTGDFQSLEERLRGAVAELDRAVAQARQDLDRYKRDNEPAPGDLRMLHQAARDGDLGPDMAELARLVDDGRDSWPAIFSGDSPNSDLLRGHLERMIAQWQEEVGAALEEDPDFDPSVLEDGPEPNP